jgi:hypothetical protein
MGTFAKAFKALGLMLITNKHRLELELYSSPQEIRWNCQEKPREDNIHSERRMMKIDMPHAVRGELVEA